MDETTNGRNVMRILRSPRYRSLFVLVFLLILFYFLSSGLSHKSFKPIQASTTGTRPASTTAASPVHKAAHIKSYEKFAVALKTGKEVALKRTPAQLLTFLSPIDKLILISESAGWVGKFRMFDVFTHLYDEHNNTDNALQKRSVHEEVIPDESSFGWKADAHKNMPGYRQLYELYPDAEWFFMLDDDTYVFWDNFLDAVSGLDPDKPHFLGSSNYFIGCDGVKNFGDGPNFAHGGSGIVLSRGALQKVVPNMDKCILKYKDCWAGDVRLALCMRDNNILVQNVEHFNRDPPHAGFWFPKDACKKPITFHHLLIEQIQKLYTLELSLREKEAPVTYGDVFNDWNSEGSGKVQKGNREGGDYAHDKCDTAEECLERCRDHDKCRAFSFVENECWLKHNIPAIKEDPRGAQTGFFADKYNCAGQGWWHF